MNSHFEVTAVSSDEPYLSEVAKREGVNFHPLEMTRKITPIKDLIAIRKLYRFLRKEKPSIVHTHTPKAGIVGMIASVIAGVPIRLHTVAGLPLMETNGIKRTILNLVEKLTYSCATRVYPNSKGLQDFIIKENLSKASKIKIIGNGSSNGIDTSHFKDNFDDQFKKDLNQAIGISSRDVVFVFVGRIVGDKGINELVEAFTAIDQTKNSCSLLLVGPFEEELDALNSDTKTTILTHNKIFHVGYQKDVRPYFAIADVLTFPSYREGFPNVVMQAGAMGLPSIVTHINGCNEIITQDVNGIIIPVKDSKSLQDAMVSLLNDKEKRLSLAAHSRSTIVDRYERQQVWDAILQEYQRLLSLKWNN